MKQAIRKSKEVGMQSGYELGAYYRKRFNAWCKRVFMFWRKPERKV